MKEQDLLNKKERTVIESIFDMFGDLAILITAILLPSIVWLVATNSKWQ